MVDQDNYVLTLVAFDPATGDITFTFTSGDIDFCEANALGNGCTNWIFTNESVDPLSMRVVDGALVDKPRAGPDRDSMTVTPTQLFIALASPPWSFISAEDAVAAARTGAMPAAIEAAIAGMDALDQMAARVTFARMQIVERNDPLVLTLAATAGVSAEQMDDFFSFAGTL